VIIVRVGIYKNFYDHLKIVSKKYVNYKKLIGKLRHRDKHYMTR